MKIISKYGVLAVVVSMLAGCANSPSEPFAGSTAADKQLLRDVYKMLVLYTNAQGCKTVDAVHTAIVERPAGTAKLMTSKERWTLSGCNQHFSYAVSFRGDGVGGTYFSVSKE